MALFAINATNIQERRNDLCHAPYHQALSTFLVEKTITVSKSTWYLLLLPNPLVCAGSNKGLHS